MPRRYHQLIPETGSQLMDDFECTTDDFPSDFSKLHVGSTIILLIL